MSNPKLPHILSASSNLLGICFVLIAGLKLTKMAEATLADEISLVAALCFSTACVLSYISLRTERDTRRFEIIADYLFLSGLLLLTFAIFIFEAGVL